MMSESRECHLCHRVGYRAFVPYGDWAWRCLYEKPCYRRIGRRVYEETQIDRDRRQPMRGTG
jgi:hypothetical protein